MADFDSGRWEGPQQMRPRWFYPALGLALVVFSIASLSAARAFDSSRVDSLAQDDDTSDVTSGDGGSGLGTDDVPAADGDADTTTATTLAELPPYDGWVNPASVGRPMSETVPGILTFRGNPTRTYYGEGPIPEDPEIVWTFPESGFLCGQSSGQQWCGTGWTGQPNVWEQDDKTWVAFGAYDYGVHWLDGDTGERLLPDYLTGDIIKGTVSIDPDEFPLLYTGSRDSLFRVIAMDREQPVELWTLGSEAVFPTKWNNDWDSSPLIIDDYLFEGGENSQIHIVKLNRGYDETGQVTVDPELVWNSPSWDDELLIALGDDEVSIENSVAISGNTLYFTNSGGLVQGWDISGLKDGETPERTFRFWAGEDMDASLVIDEEGFIYGGVEYEKGRARAQEVGQLIKLDPTKPNDPLVWSIDDGFIITSGAWATPALYGDLIYAAFNSGRVIAADRETGEIIWEKNLGSQTWQSPVVVDDTLIMGDCNGTLHAYDVSDPLVDPPEIWSVELPGCIESTPAVWNGRIYVGTRGGQVHAIADPTTGSAGADSDGPPTTDASGAGRSTAPTTTTTSGSGLGLGSG